MSMPKCQRLYRERADAIHTIMLRCASCFHKTDTDPQTWRNAIHGSHDMYLNRSKHGWYERKAQGQSPKAQREPGGSIAIAGAGSEGEGESVPVPLPCPVPVQQGLSASLCFCFYLLLQSVFIFSPIPPSPSPF
jgi:hypothetical protein